MAKGNGGGFKEGRKSRPAKGGELNPTDKELRDHLAQTSNQSTPVPTEVPPRDQDKDIEIKLARVKRMLEGGNRFGVLRTLDDVISGGDSEQTEQAIQLFQQYKPELAQKVVEPVGKANGWDRVFDELVGKIDVIQQSEQKVVAPPAPESAPEPVSEPAPEVPPTVPITPVVEVGESKVIPPELEHLSPEEQKTYEKIPAEKRESYLTHVAEMRAEKEKKERKNKNKKSAKPRSHKPKSQPESVKPLTPMPPEFYEPKPKPDYIAEQLAAMVAKKSEAAQPSAEERVAAGKPNPEADEEYPAVFRYNRDRRGNDEVQIEPEQIEDVSPKVEGTPKEWREKLRALIEGAKEKFEWWKSAEEGLVRRNAELDAQLEKIGGVEKGFRWVGEKYNKLGWKSKLAVGAGLGLGAVFTAGTGAVAIPLALIAGQRIAGLSTMYLKFEKNSHEEKWGKEKAMLKAGVYTVLMGLAMKEAIEYASGTELAHAAQAKVEHTIQGWLGTMLGHESITTATNEGVGATAPTPGPAEPITGTEASHTATASGVRGFQAEVRHADFAAEQSPTTGFQAEVRAVDNAIPEPRTSGFQAEVRAVDNATVIEAPRVTGFQAEVRAIDNAIPEPKTTGFQADVRRVDIGLEKAAGEVAAPAPAFEMPTVGASSHGYEGMLKDLIKKLPDTPPADMKPDSDLAKLFEAKADPKSIGGAIHRIAMEHKFFTGEGSARIDTGAQMTIDANGNVLFNGEVQAPAGAHFIPEHSAAGATSVSPELSAETIVTPPEVAPGPNLTEAQDLAQQKIDAMNQAVAAAVAEPNAPPPFDSSVLHDGSGNVVVDGSGNPVHVGSYEQPATDESLSNVTPAEAAEGIVITETPVTSAEVSPAQEVQPLPGKEVVSPEPAVTVDTTNAPEFVSEPHTETPSAEAAATQAPAPVVEQGFISNQLGLKIPVAESHIYVDPAARDVFAYGGSPVERAKSMLAYLTENPNKVVFAADDSGKYRIPWHLVEGKLTPGAPIRTSGLFGLFPSFMKAPEPEEFAKLIK